MNFAISVMWVSTSIAICYGIYITGSAYCLWGFVAPMLVMEVTE